MIPAIDSKMVDNAGWDNPSPNISKQMPNSIVDRAGRILWSSTIENTVTNRNSIPDIMKKFSPSTDSKDNPTE